MQTTELRRYKHLINGEWVDSDSGQTITRNNPATGQPVSEFAAGSQEDTWRAIDAARAAFDRGPWPRMTGAERGQFLLSARPADARGSGAAGSHRSTGSGQDDSVRQAFLYPRSAGPLTDLKVRARGTRICVETRGAPRLGGVGRTVENAEHGPWSP